MEWWGWIILLKIVHGPAADLESTYRFSRLSCGFVLLQPAFPLILLPKIDKQKNQRLLNQFPLFQHFRNFLWYLYNLLPDLAD